LLSDCIDYCLAVVAVYSDLVMVTMALLDTLALLAALAVLAEMVMALALANLCYHSQLSAMISFY